MGREHYIYMNGSSGCMPDTLDVFFTVGGCVSLFESIFGDSLYQGFNLEIMLEVGAISREDIEHDLKEFLGEENFDPYNDVAFFIDEGYIKNANGDVLEAIDLYGKRAEDALVADFRDTGYVILGPAFGADYASWNPCFCDSPWEHSGDSEEDWLRDNGDEWFTEHFELKIRYEGDNLPWERIEPLCLGWSEKLTEQEMEWLITERFVDNDRRVIREVRWNWEGVSQGHYFIPKYEEEGE